MFTVPEICIDSVVLQTFNKVMITGFIFSCHKNSKIVVGATRQLIITL